MFAYAFGTGGNVFRLGDYGSAIMNLLLSNFDTSDVSRPNSYLIWMLYDNNMRLIPEGSGAKRVSNPNELGTLIEDEIPALTDGYLHCFVSNSAVQPVSYDNFLVSYLRGKTRQINHYYPYGLSIDGLSRSDEYLNKYTSKELQFNGCWAQARALTDMNPDPSGTGEFGSTTSSSGLEMFDFHARFYDPALGRWFVPDPAEQFHNPYLAMGNNPVMYVDPDGEFIMFAVAIGAISNMIIQGLSGNVNNGQDASGALLVGGMAGMAGEAAGLAAGGGLGFGAGALQGGVSGFVGGFTGGTGNAWFNGVDAFEGLNIGLRTGGIGAVTGAVFGGISGAIAQSKLDKFNQEMDKLLASADDEFYYNKLIADASKRGYFINADEFPRVNFSTDDVVGDMIRQMKMIKVSAHYKTYGDWFDANTISKSDGWNMSGTGTGGFGWRKNFTWKGKSVQVYAAPASAHSTKLYGFSEGKTALGRQFGLVGVNKNYLTYLNFQSRLQFDVVSNSIMSAWAPGYRHAPIIIKSKQDYQPLYPWQR